MISFTKRNNTFCDIKCKNKFYKEKKSEYDVYKSDCQFNFKLSDYPDEFDFELITQHGWYSPTNGNNNLGGVSRDHMISISDGFKFNIDPKQISHPANCQLLIHTDNISKNKKSSISYDGLKRRIDEWNKKY